ncbi:hypothetical protein PANT_16c00060 [Moesziomyces antarcticus T-34]|uniref:Uncharacterized protein n=1 Tax=Pseudozyma antarctica (strain T-34) TaxID=1151754 RepID=M9MGY3_PSEA3|nr:hypothetical protein PANT_16c00060 [Moesziomyces antarcticus T-34]
MPAVGARGTVDRPSLTILSNTIAPAAPARSTYTHERVPGSRARHTQPWAWPSARSGRRSSAPKSSRSASSGTLLVPRQCRQDNAHVQDDPRLGRVHRAHRRLQHR